jgi:hypothetical protein
MVTTVRLVLQFLSLSYSYLRSKKAIGLTFQSTCCASKCVIIFAGIMKLISRLCKQFTQGIRDTVVIARICKSQLEISSSYLRFFCNLSSTFEALAAPSASVLLVLCSPLLVALVKTVKSVEVAQKAHAGQHILLR